MTDLFMRRPHLDDLPPLPPLPPGRTLRPFQAGDLDGLAALLAVAFPDAADPWTPGRTRRDLMDDPTVRTTWLILDDTRPIATASSRLLPDQYPGSGYVHWVAADPALAGQRLGYTVTLAVLHEFARLGCRDAVLETQAFRLPAIKTYSNLGFVPQL